MTQGTLYVTDANSAKQGLEESVNPSTGNLMPNVVVTDAAGNRINALAPGNVALPVQAEGVKAAYRFAVLGVAPVATPTDILEIKGSATKTVRIRQIKVSGGATAAANFPLSLVRRSTASTGGGSTLNAITAFKPDTGYAAATATAGYFSAANPTLGTGVGGPGGVGRVQLPALATGVAALPLKWVFDINALVLRGASEYLYINGGGTALPAGTVLDFEIELQEDGS